MRFCINDILNLHGVNKYFSLIFFKEKQANVAFYSGAGFKLQLALFRDWKKSFGAYILLVNVYNAYTLYINK